jgi:hypothetical protein
MNDHADSVVQPPQMKKGHLCGQILGAGLWLHCAPLLDIRFLFLDRRSSALIPAAWASWCSMAMDGDDLVSILNSSLRDQVHSLRLRTQGVEAYAAGLSWCDGPFLVITRT